MPSLVLPGRPEASRKPEVPVPMERGQVVRVEDLRRFFDLPPTVKLVRREPDTGGLESLSDRDIIGPDDMLSVITVNEPG